MATPIQIPSGMNDALWPLRRNVVSANAARPRGAGSATGTNAGTARSVVTAMSATSFSATRSRRTSRQVRCGVRIPTGGYAKRPDRLVTVDLEQAFVADAEMVGELVEDDSPDLAAQQLRVVPVEPHERAAVDRDLVREDAAVVAAPGREGNALVEAEQALPARRFLFDHDAHVRDARAQLGWEGVERVLHEFVEPIQHADIFAAAGRFPRPMYD